NPRITRAIFLRRRVDAPLQVVSQSIRIDPAFLRGSAGLCARNPRRDSRLEIAMFPKPKPALTPNTYAYESEPLVKPTGFREYDARWLLGKEINLMGVQALGLGLGSLIHELRAKPEVVTGHDFRGYSASVKN